MSQTNTNTNNGQNRNQIFRRGGRGQRSDSRGRSDCRNNCGNNSITNNSLFEGIIKDCPISKLIITKTWHKPTQYKKNVDTLPVLCADTNYQGIDDIIWTGNDLVKRDFMSPYPDTNQWSTTHHVEIRTVNPTDPAAADGLRPPTFETLEQTHVF